MELEFAKAVVHHAAFYLESEAEDEPHLASMAKAMASDVYMKTAREAVQMRGGIGFTWEEDTHLWYKRAKSSEVFMGSPHNAPRPDDYAPDRYGGGMNLDDIRNEVGAWLDANWSADRSLIEMAADAAGSTMGCTSMAGRLFWTWL